MNPDEILRVNHLKQHFHIHKGLTIKAVDGVTFQVKKGEVFGLVGESGSGKSTVARTIMGIYPATSGDVYFKGQRISEKEISRQIKKDLHLNMQIIFQDSAAALNPRMTVEEIITEPLKVNRIVKNKNELRAKLESLLREVGLDNSYKTKRPAEISGGQRQRVAIARCLSTSPDLIIADEPVASLDVSIQAQIINLFQRLQREHGFSFLLIAHDLSIIKFICDKVAVMLQGRLMELAPAQELFNNPLHPYTRSLLSAVPVPDPVFERNKKIIDYDVQNVKTKVKMVEAAPGHYVWQ
ncbi:ATPase component of various ABC-type transport systems with duplicated ATPase domain [Desulfosporosinus orientis DSM 765]|uniref:ATPase component of various ABC-type transport systems with duplicated ATPase domain n=1 Tax=Desulfosporosinus orientis (strain ATCC 19365 / DSM 765 / NCIMB 8382 / VKM B-1628 / Singapore I) TaxID=768706 RepID=G7WFJ5_DESOD|nr:ATP-binding cassette domain-containing protein [Desulfosporosinus orientis]AET68438.1 ATPase component of various ABC-type transport systems with duplicated ATPase domain [Desulfosporosinus orientis DSM 765]